MRSAKGFQNWTYFCVGPSDGGDMAVHFKGLGWSLDTIFVCRDTESLN
jgi:hypothetical protein